MPFAAVYYVIRELVSHMSGQGALDREYLITLGWFAGGSAAGAVALNFCALMC